MTLMNHLLDFDIKSMLSSLKVQYESEGESERKINGIASITEAKPWDLSFCWYEGDKAVDLVSRSDAGIILCKKSLQGILHPKKGRQVIFLEKPRQVFVIFANKMLERKKKPTRISPTAVISKKVTIGDRCDIGDYAVIGDNCRIGSDSVIYDKVTLVSDCVVGDRCIIHSGVTLGDDGFAFERDEK